MQIHECTALPAFLFFFLHVVPMGFKHATAATLICPEMLSPASVNIMLFWRLLESLGDTAAEASLRILCHVVNYFVAQCQKTICGVKWTVYRISPKLRLRGSKRKISGFQRVVWAARMIAMSHGCYQALAGPQHNWSSTFEQYNHCVVMLPCWPLLLQCSVC